MILVDQKGVIICSCYYCSGTKRTVSVNIIGNSRACA